MRNFFVFGGTASTDYNTWIAQSNAFDAPERDVEKIEVPGRNGDLHFDNGRFKNFTLKVTAYTQSEFVKNVDGLRNWLASQKGYQRYEENLCPDEYRLARFSDAFEVEASDRSGGYYELTFDCKPQRFLKPGEAATELTSSGAISNPTNFPAHPLVRVYGTGVLGIGSQTITINKNDTYIDLDCDIEDAFTGTTNQNGNITLNSGDFFTLDSGENGVSLGSGITKVLITPRWWRL